MAQQGQGGGSVLTGIRGTIGGLTSGASYFIDIETGGTGTFASFATYGPFTDNGQVEIQFPRDGVTRWMRGWIRKTGFADSGFTATVSGEPTELNPLI